MPSFIPPAVSNESWQEALTWEDVVWLEWNVLVSRRGEASR